MTTPTSSTYREYFDETEAGRYQDVVYGDRSHATLVWEIQRDLVDALLDDPTFVPHREAYLDFACGTGRITGHVAPRFEHAVGVDISASMLAHAAERLPDVELVCANVSEDPGSVEGPFDLVSMFRFVLNADPDDVAAALTWVRSRLRDDDSRVLANNQGNQYSYMLGWKMARVALRRDHRRETGNILSDRRIAEIFRAGGFEVERRVGCGLLPPAALRAIDYDRLLGLERRLQPRVGRAGFDQLYVLRPV
jgi:SAM-dependent methyltransferase